MGTKDKGHKALAMNYWKKGELGRGQVTHSVVIIPLLGRDILTKMRAQIHFGLEGVDVLDKNGPIYVLTLALEDYKLFPQPMPSPSPLLQFPKVHENWAERNSIRLAHQRAPIIGWGYPSSHQTISNANRGPLGITPHINQL